MEKKPSTILPRGSWKMREETARQDLRTIATIGTDSQLCKVFGNADKPSIDGERPGIQGREKLEPPPGSSLGMALHRLAGKRNFVKVACPLETRLWPDLLVTVNVYIYVCSGTRPSFSVSV